MANVACISHSQDVDGLVCAALLKMAKDAECILTDYPFLLDEIKKTKEDVSTLYICDLSIGTLHMGELGRISKSSKVIYIDHHPISDEILETLKNINMSIVHSTKTSAGMLTYQMLEKELPDDASILAAYAVLADYPYRSEDLSRFLERFDSHLLAFEYSLLYYSIARAYNDDQFKNRIVDGLSQLKYPHEIENVVRFAKEQVEYTLDLVRNADNRVSYGRNLAYIEVTGGTGIANLLVYALGKPTVICYSRCKDETYYCLSVRGRDHRYDLGVITSEIARKLGGFGGGHPLAAGAQLPTQKLVTFIRFLDDALDEKQL